MQKGEVINRSGHRPPSVAIPPRNSSKSSTLRKTNYSDDSSTRSNSSHQSCSNPFKHKSKANFPSFESAFHTNNIKKNSSLCLINESFEDDSFLETISHSVFDLDYKTSPLKGDIDSFSTSDLSRVEKSLWGKSEKESISPLTEEDLYATGRGDPDESILDQTVDSFFNSSRVECLITPEKSKLIGQTRPGTRGNTSLSNSMDSSILSSKSRSHNRRLSVGSLSEDVEEEGDMIQLFNRVLQVQNTKTSTSFNGSNRCVPEPTSESLEYIEDPSFIQASFLKDEEAPIKNHEIIDIHSPFDGTFCLEESIMIFNHESPDLVLNTTFKDQSVLEDEISSSWTPKGNLVLKPRIGDKSTIQSTFHGKNIELMQDSPPMDKSGVHGFDMSLLLADQDEMDSEYLQSNAETSISTTTQDSTRVQSTPCVIPAKSSALESKSYTYPGYLMRELQNKYLNSDLIKLSKDLFLKNKLSSNTAEETEEGGNINEALRRPFGTLASKYLSTSKNQTNSVDSSLIHLGSSGSVRNSTSSMIINNENELRHSLSTSFHSNYEYKFVDPDSHSPEKIRGFSVNNMLCHWRT